MRAGQTYMKSIWKYPLRLTEHQYFEIPVRAIPLCIELQNGTPTIWFEVETTNPKKDRSIRIIGTGEELDFSELYHYLGSFLIAEDSLVFHVYVETSF